MFNENTESLLGCTLPLCKLYSPPCPKLPIIHLLYSQLLTCYHSGGWSLNKLPTKTLMSFVRKGHLPSEVHLRHQIPSRWDCTHTSCVHYQLSSLSIIPLPASTTRCLVFQTQPFSVPHDLGEQPTLQLGSCNPQTCTGTPATHHPSGNTVSIPGTAIGQGRRMHR